MSGPDPVLALRGISKVFGTARVLDGVDFDLLPGEVHSLVGENGAGKSTLLKIVSGVYRPDGGQLLVDGTHQSFATPADAQTLGLAMIYQEPTLFPDLDVAENIYLGLQPLRAGPFIDRRAMYGGAQELLNTLGARIRPRSRVAELSVADQQLVEIAAALTRQARIVIMDEPTASLTPHEVEGLFRVIRQLTRRRVAVVFISHRLEEVFAISDRITVLRDGRLIETMPTAQATREGVIRAMVGRELTALFAKQPATIGPPVLECEGLTRRGVFGDISFTLRSGEILGLAGLIGAGRTEVARAIFGIDPLDAGQIRIDGKPVQIRSTKDALALRLALVPEDRQKQGLILTQSVSANITLAILRHIATAGWIRRERERSIASSLAGRLQLRARGLSQSTGQLSGGNQQKVVLAKWLVTHPRVLILDEPTRGIDIGAKAEVHRLMGELAAQGLAILMISSDLPEVLAMSDRIVVMREGRVAARFERAEASPERIMFAATGEPGAA